MVGEVQGGRGPLNGTDDDCLILVTPLAGAAEEVRPLGTC